MKGKAAAAAVLLLATAIIPIGAAKCADKSQSVTQITGVSTSDTPKKSNNADNNSQNALSDEKTAALTAAWYKDEYCEETIKAIAIIMNTNYTASPESFSDNDFLYEENADADVKAAYDKIKACVSQAKNTVLCQNGKAVFVPVSQSSNGFTCESREYPYLCAVSSVWDCFLSNYSPSEKCLGVSLSGLNYLCENGETAQSALKWYLPKLDMSDISR